ncbi:MAG: T9SS type A sorting domain-containing protein [Flavobacteriales bacterium]|jgi:N-acetylneuraminic acid mutarotase|nr:T9SS type A sorting domain-containing protein [Flavobacteriales bacterium]
MAKLLLLLLFIPVPFIAQWTQVSSLPSSFQTDHSFGFAINDTGYIVTGSHFTSFGSFPSNKFYKYSPNDDTWTQLDDFPGGNRGFGIGDVWDNKAYFGFGLNFDNSTGASIYKNDLWEFNPSTSTWTELTSCPCNTRIHPAFVTHQGNIYMGLGNDSNGNLNDWWQYNITTDSWIQKANFPSYERHHPYQFAIGDYVYVGFGHGTAGDEIYDTWYRYNPTDNTWIEVQSIPAEGRVAGTQFSHNGFGYILSGDGSDHQSMEEGEFWKYDPIADSWEQMPSHPGQSRWAPASFVLDDHAYIINGTSYDIYQSEVYKYNMNDNNITHEVTKEPLIEPIISPNPFSDKIVIKVDQLNTEHLNAKIKNILGQTIIETTISSNSSFSVEKLIVGIYFIEFYNNERLISSRKIIKQ